MVKCHRAYESLFLCRQIFAISNRVKWNWKNFYMFRVELATEVSLAASFIVDANLAWSAAALFLAGMEFLISFYLINQLIAARQIWFQFYVESFSWKERH